MPLARSQWLMSFKERLANFAGDHGATLSDADALDMVGPFWGDLRQLRDEPPKDWHCIRWNSEAAQTPELYDVACDRHEALGAVLEHAHSESHDIEEVTDEDDEIVVWRDGAEYARIGRVAYEAVDERLAQRMDTLLAPLSVSDEVGLIRQLTTLPAWDVDALNSMPVWSNLEIPVGSPRTGDWLPKMSEVFNPKSGKMRDFAPGHAEREHECNRMPMWVTPQSSAKLLQLMISEKASRKPKLSACQEVLASALGYASWQHLVARFRQEVFLQALMRQGGVDAYADLKFYRSPAELLASVYEQACEMQRGGQRLHLDISWLSDRRPEVRLGCLSRDEMRRRIAETEGPPPQSEGMSIRELRAVGERWEEAEHRMRVEFAEWHTTGLLGMPTTGASEAMIDEARQWIDACSRSQSAFAQPQAR